MVHRRRAALLEGDAVDLGMAEGAEGAQAGVVDDHRLGLVLANNAVEAVFLPVGVGLAPIAVKPQAPDRAIAGAEHLDRLV